MNAVDRQKVLQVSEKLVQQEHYEQALLMLEPLECIMASWMKGSIYLSAAKKIANSFQFKFYMTEGLKEQYRELLSHAYDYLCRTSSLMPTASDDIRKHLNQHLWHDIGKVENELSRMRPVVDEPNNYDYDENYQEDINHHVDSVTDEIRYWDLTNQE